MTVENGSSNDWVCIFRHLFSIVCANPCSFSRLGEFEHQADAIAKHTCWIHQNETRIGLDLLAFTFIVLQLRVLNSYFFQWCIVEIRCEVVQASR